MMSELAGFHTIAAQRGDGLRPDLLRLLQNARMQIDNPTGVDACTLQVLPSVEEVTAPEGSARR